MNVPTSAGDIGVLANHVPSIQQLRPGIVEVIEESGTSNKFFVTGGFATVNPGSTIDINAVEAYPLEDISADVSCD